MVILASFYINRSYIATYLCKNRSRPELKCNGTCFLAQKLRQAEQKEAGQTPHIDLKEEFALYPDTLPGIFCSSLPVKRLPFPEEAWFISPAFGDGVFRPPAC
ncbi:MAG: hypothetical protein EAZ89_01970 [Bacteroidetes bacterium]|nr:MAG: hypothetical protein EAZ89_01970 [Bacteroidota bacterium]